MIGVTGCTGFLGRRLIALLEASQERVRALVEPGAGSELASNQVQRVELDLVGEADLRGALDGLQVLVNLAAAGVQPSGRGSSGLLAVNTLAPTRLMEAAHDAAVERVILVGTSMEYRGMGSLPDAPLPDTSQAPLCAEADSLESTDPYGASKAAGGIAARAAARRLGVPTWYLRLASIFGPGDAPSKLLPTAVRLARSGQPLDLSPGEQVRDYLGIADAMDTLLQTIKTEPRGVETLNIGTGQGHTLLSVVQGIYRAAGQDVSLVRPGGRPYRPNEPHHLVLDPHAAEERLGWRSTVETHQGLAELVKTGSSE